MEMAPRSVSPDPSECDSLDELAMAHTPQHDDEAVVDTAAVHVGFAEGTGSQNSGQQQGRTRSSSPSIPVMKLSELRKLAVHDEDDDDDVGGDGDGGGDGENAQDDGSGAAVNERPPALDVSSEDAFGSPSDKKKKKKGRGGRFAGLRDSLRMKQKSRSEESDKSDIEALAETQRKVETGRDSKSSRPSSGASRSRGRSRKSKDGSSDQALTPEKTDDESAEKRAYDKKTKRSSSKGRSKKRSMSPFRKRYAKLGDAEEATNQASSGNANGGEADVGSDDDVDLDEEDLAEDPLIDLFETHNTKRVVFDPTFVPPPKKDESGKASLSPGSFNIKSFMNRIIVKGGKEKEAEVQGIPIVQEPPPPRTPTPTRRPTSALRGGGRASSSPDDGAPDSGGAVAPSKKTSFDPYVIDRAMSRSTNTAAVAVAAIGRSGDEVAASSSSPTGPSANFAEDPAVAARAKKVLARANRAHHRTYRYEHAIGYYLAALSILSKAGYPEDHEMFAKTVKRLNDCHHAQSSLKNSANIVKMGIKHENRGEFVRALKMYTIAYRIRRDALGKFHPSLPVLLNMLGSVQVKRGELREAMQIYELALNGRPDDLKGVSERRKSEMIHPTTKSVTLRDMGMIYERWGDDDRAIELYQESLDYVMRGREREGGAAGSGSGAAVAAGSEANGRDRATASSRLLASFGRGNRGPDKEEPPLCALGDVKTIKSYKNEKMKRPSSPHIRPTSPSTSLTSCGEEGEMEVYLEPSVDSLPVRIGSGGADADKYYYYDAFFPETNEEKKEGKSKSKGKSGKNRSSKDSGSSGRGGTDVNVAMTLHQIAQINRRRGQYAVALSAYQVSLRGMKHALGDRHPNVAAILGNLGNLHKEMGNFDQAYAIYQEVLGIETHHLGLSHPEVSVTLHNIATIESSRGRYSDAITLYTQVVKMQRSLFGPNHISVAVTSSCMGDVYERMGDIKNAMNMYEETLRIRTEIIGRQHVDVGRLLHKLGSLAQKRGDYKNADIYITRAAFIYKFNQLGEDHPWVRDITRDEADIKAFITMGSDQMEL